MKIGYNKQDYVEWTVRTVAGDQFVVEQVPGRDPTRLEAPLDAYKFKYFRIHTVTVDDDGDEIKFPTVRTKESGTHFIGGTRINRTDAMSRFGSANLGEETSFVVTAIGTIERFSASDRTLTLNFRKPVVAPSASS